MTQGVLMGSVTVVITLLMLLLVFFDHPHGGGVGRLQPTAMERTMRLIDTETKWSASPWSPRATPMATHADEAAGGRPELAGARGHGAAGRGCSRDVVEQLPGHTLERRAGGRGGSYQRRADQRGAGTGAGAGTDAGGRRHLHRLGRCDRQGDRELAAFYVDRFRDEFKPAFDAWRATAPFSNPDAPPTPFAMPEYQLASRTDAEQLDVASEASAAQVRLYIQRSSNYVLTVVLYAVVLFFAGMSTRLTNPRLRWVMTLAGCLVLLGDVAWLATFPVSVQV